MSANSPPLEGMAEESSEEKLFESVVEKSVGLSDSNNSSMFVAKPDELIDTVKDEDSADIDKSSDDKLSVLLDLTEHSLLANQQEEKKESEPGLQISEKNLTTIRNGEESGDEKMLPPVEQTLISLPQTIRSPPAASSSSSTPWASYLRRAVANVEQTLDKVLQESTTDVSTLKASSSSSSVSSPSLSEPSSSAKLSMQDRLALAVGRASSGSPGPLSPGIAPISPGGSSRTSVEGSSVDNARKSEENLDNSDNSRKTNENGNSSDNNRKTEDKRNSSESVASVAATATLATSGNVSIKTLKAGNIEGPSLQTSLQLSKQLLDMISLLNSQNDDVIQRDNAVESIKKSMITLYDNIELQQRRVQDYTQVQQERLEVVESKLMILAKSEVERTKRAKSSFSGTEKALAEKDEYIALLLEEGQMLSRQELKHMNTIKRLRAKDKDSEKSSEGLLKRAEKAEKELADTKLKLKRSTEAERRQSDNIKALSKLESETISLRKERESLTEKISSLEITVKELNIQNDTNASKAREEALTSANEKIGSLQAELDECKDQFALNMDRKAGEIDALQIQIRREIENASRKESILRDEIKALEARVEHYRALSEAASTDTSKDAHMNLLRQMEVLQSQHSIAIENWHGIEANYLNRISSLETELEECKTQESYQRKRLKSVTESLKSQSEQEDDMRERLSDLEAEHSRTKKEVQRLTNEINEVRIARQDYEIEVESEKSELRNEIDGLNNQINELQEKLTVAPSAGGLTEILTTGNGSDGEFLQQQQHLPREGHPPEVSPIIPGYAGGSRQRSVGNGLDLFMSGGSFGSSPGGIGNSGGLMSPTPYSSRNSPDISRRASSRIFSMSSESGIPSVDERTDYFDDSATQDGGVADSSSTYTASGGVSLQLVGKMNMTIRRLESDLANCRQDLTKMTQEKDDAYQEVIQLMKDNEELDTLKAKSSSLEAKVSQLEAREQTTLEMLGEKSEIVLELKADVEDLKAMYRQQIEELVDQLHSKK